VVAREEVSGWVEARVLRGSPGSAGVARFLWEDIVCRWGCFQELGCDGGAENRSMVEALTHLLRIHRVVASPYNSHQQGGIERVHLVLINALMRVTDGGRLPWASYLHLVLWADRTTVKASTGMTPARVMFGEEHVLPIELEVKTWQTLPWGRVRSTADLLVLRAWQMDVRNASVDEAKSRQRRMRDEANERWEHSRGAQIRHEPLTTGSLVLLHNTKVVKDFGSKLTFIWLGPYRVRQVKLLQSTDTPSGVYLLEELDGTPIAAPIRGDRLKKFVVPEAGDIEINRVTGMAGPGQGILRDDLTDGPTQEYFERADATESRIAVEVAGSESFPDGGDGDDDGAGIRRFQHVEVEIPSSFDRHAYRSFDGDGIFGVNAVCW
jgi:hypothetical protein